MPEGSEQSSSIVFLAQRLSQLHLTLGDRIPESEAASIKTLVTRISHENCDSLADAAVQLMLAAATLELISEGLVKDPAASNLRIRRHVLSALKILATEAPAALAACGLEFFIGTQTPPLEERRVKTS